MHLLLDLMVKDAVVLTDERLLRSWLRAIIETLALDIVDNPCLFKFPNGSFTLFACLKQSSVLVHTYPETKMVYIDIFSCKELPAGTLYQVCDQYFKIQDERRVLLLSRL